MDDPESQKLLAAIEKKNYLAVCRIIILGFYKAMRIGIIFITGPFLGSVYLLSLTGVLEAGWILLICLVLYFSLFRKISDAAKLAFLQFMGSVLCITLISLDYFSKAKGFSVWIKEFQTLPFFLISGAAILVIVLAIGFWVANLIKSLSKKAFGEGIAQLSFDISWILIIICLFVCFIYYVIPNTYYYSFVYWAFGYSLIILHVQYIIKYISDFKNK